MDPFFSISYSHKNVSQNHISIFRETLFKHSFVCLCCFFSTNSLRRNKAAITNHRLPSPILQGKYQGCLYSTMGPWARQCTGALMTTIHRNTQISMGPYTCWNMLKRSWLMHNFNGQGMVLIWCVCCVWCVWLKKSKNYFGCLLKLGRKERNALFNDALNTFYFTVIWRRTYGKGPLR